MGILETAADNPTPVNLKDIDETPGPYCMSFAFDLQPLISSIKKCGLINRPIVAKCGEGRADIVIGYRRMLALKRLKWKTVPCRVLSDSDISPLRLLLLNLYDNLSVREFNEVEKGMILSRLVSLLPREEIAKDYMPLLGLPARESTLDVFLRIEGLDPPLKESLARGQISFQTTKALIEIDVDSRDALLGWIMNLRLNFNQQLQFIEYTSDLSIKEEVEISELLGQRQFLRILEDKKRNNPQKAKLVLELLRSNRFPSLTRSEKAFQKKVSSLALPDGIRISYPPFFEGADYRLEILFKNGKQLKEKVDAMQNASGLETLGDPWQEEDKE